MSKNILVLGALGNIGSELIKLLSNKKFSKYNIVLIDKKFEINILKKIKKNFIFYQSNIYNLNKKMVSIIKKSDIIFFLAAEVEAEKSIDRERVIWEENYNKPKKIINLISNKTRIFFTSSGNIFGGISSQSKFLNLNENDTPQPKYPYAETKYALEKYIKTKVNNFTILRLGTNYGFADGMRFNIVTNKFMRSALLNEDITIHGSGNNYRPTVCVKDVARAMIFLMENKKAKNQTFHLSDEALKIKDLAKKVIFSMNSKSKILNIVKEVPFNSYGLCSSKIKKLGFKFKWTVSKASKDFKKKFSFTC